MLKIYTNFFLILIEIESKSWKNRPQIQLLRLCVKLLILQIIICIQGYSPGYHQSLSSTIECSGLLLQLLIGTSSLRSLALLQADETSKISYLAIALSFFLKDLSFHLYGTVPGRTLQPFLLNVFVPRVEYFRDALIHENIYRSSFGPTDHQCFLWCNLIIGHNLQTNITVGLAPTLWVNSMPYKSH